MTHIYYLEQSKEIYKSLKDTFLAETQKRANFSIEQVVDPQKIKPEFRLLVGDLCYRLSHYKRLLDVEEKILHNSPYEVRVKIEKELLSLYGDKMFNEMNQAAKALEPLCSDLSPQEHFIYKTYFQEYLLELITFCSAASGRAYVKPNGYAGDYALMEMFASDNIYRGKTLYEKCIYRWTVTWPSAAPVKSRLKVIYNELDKTTQELFRSKDHLKILDLACGPSIPIQWLLKNPASDKLEVFFIDQDAEAIENLQRRIRDVKEYYQRRTQFHFYNQSIQKLLLDPDTLSQLAGQDFIVSSGLFDYLDDKLARMLIEVLYSLLTPGGILLIGNLSSTEPTTAFQWYIVEWPLNFRTKEKLLSLAPEGTNPEILTEELGFNLFLKIKKN